MAKPKWNMSPLLKQCLVASSVSLNNIAHTCAFSFLVVLLPQARDSMQLSTAQESWLASITAVAMFAGNLLTMPVIRHGRRLTHQLVSLLSLGGRLIITMAPNFEILMIGRFIQGASTGLSMPVMGMILAEYTSPVYRGAFLATCSLSQAVGVVTAHLAGMFLDWRDTALLFSFLPLTSFAITTFTPESPSWLAVARRYEECREAFRWLRGWNEEEELERMIRARQQLDCQAKTGIHEARRAFSKRELYIPLALGALMYAIFVACGSVMVASYMTDIIRVLLGPDCTVSTWMVALDGIRLVTNGAALYVVHQLPRRTMLFGAGGACVAAYLAQAAYVYAQCKVGLWLPAALLIWHIATIGLGLAMVPYVIISEIFPLQYRSMCSFISNVWCCLFVFLVLKTFRGMCAGMGLEGTYVVYAGVMALALLGSWFLLPETRGRTLQEIEEHFRGEPLVPEDMEAREALNGLKSGKT